MFHHWPRNQDEHMWSEWWPYSKGTMDKPPMRYRFCQHIECKAIEVKEYINA